MIPTAGSALLAAVLLAVVAVSAVAGLAAARVRAQTAADAAALAAVGAAPLAGGDGDACDAAGHVAAANGAHLVGCEGPEEGWSLEVDVIVVVPPAGPARLLPPLRARAAAVLEPVPSPTAPGGPPAAGGVPDGRGEATASWPGPGRPATPAGAPRRRRRAPRGRPGGV